MMSEQAEIGIIGGSGIYEAGLFEESKELKVYTPYGETSDLITIGTYLGRRVAFLPRHGKGHRIPPHKVNSRANVWALKQLGVKRIISPSAVGSLKMNLRPGDIVLPDQFIDRTQGRPSTFYEGGKVCHISVADPFCPELREVALKASQELGIRVHQRGTYVCIQGPRYSTRAESKMFRSWGGDIIGMTLVPECVLAREAEICYLTLAAVTDYDVWAEKPVTAEEVVKVLKENVEKLRRLIKAIIPKIPQERRCPCKDALKEAII